MPKYTIEFEGKVIEELNLANPMSSSQLKDYATNHSLLRKQLGRRHVIGVVLEEGKAIVSAGLPVEGPAAVLPANVKEAQDRVAAGLAGQIRITNPTGRPPEGGPAQPQPVGPVVVGPTKT